MRNSSYAPHYAISRYSIRDFNTGAEPFMVAMIIIIIIVIIILQTGTKIKYDSGDSKWYAVRLCIYRSLQ